MKRLLFFLFLLPLLITLKSCEKGETLLMERSSKTEGISRLKNEISPALPLSSALQMQLTASCSEQLIMPPALVNLCLEGGNCSGAQNWLNSQWANNLKKCESAKGIGNKYRIMKCELIPLASYYQELGLASPCFCSNFCGLVTLYEELNKQCASIIEVEAKRPVIEQMLLIREIAQEFGFESELDCIPDNCSGFCNLVTYYDKLNKDCGALTELSEKGPQITKLLELATLIMELHIPWSEDPGDACGCILDAYNEEIKIEIEPSTIILDPEEELQLNHQIFCNCENPIICNGTVEWEIDNSNVAEIDSQTGALAAKQAGTALVTVKSTLYPHIKGTATVKVGAGIDIVLVFESGYAADWIVGGQYSISGWPGLQQLGGEILSALDNTFGDDYRFGLVGFEHYPILPWGSTLGYCTEIGNAVSEYEPLIEMDDYLPYLSLTDNRSAISNSLASVKMMCSWHESPYGWSASPFSAVIKTIRNYSWREDARKVVILYGLTPATYVQNAPPASGEGYSGYTVGDIASAAAAEGVNVFTINGLSGKSGNIADVSLAEYQAIANTTFGLSYEGPINSTLEPITVMLQRIKDVY